MLQLFNLNQEKARNTQPVRVRRVSQPKLPASQESIEAERAALAAWTAKLCAATLVLGAASHDALCYNGPWTDDLVLRLRFDTSLPKALRRPSRSKRAEPRLIVSSHRLAGIYCVKRVHTSAKVVDCFVPNYKGSKFDPMPWSFTLPPREDPEGNLCVSATPSLTGDAVVWIAPPLRFHTRMTVFHLDEINIIAQTFSADTLCSLRLRGISSASDPALVDRLFAAYGFKDSLVDLLMVVETKSTERWANIERSSTHPGLYDYVLKLKVRSILAEEYELHNFPCDTQDMHIHLTVNVPIERAELFSDDQDPSLMMHKRFQHASIYDIVHKQMLLAAISCSNVEESASANIYPRCTFHTTLNRRYSYYVVNVALPLAILTFLAGLSAGAVDADGKRVTTADRLSITLTLLLTAVAYKFIVSSSLPQVSYLTSMDSYVLSCFFFMLLVIIENVVWPAIVAGNDGVEPFNELYIMLAYLSLFALFNAAYAGFVCVKLVDRAKRQHNISSVESDMSARSDFMRTLEELIGPPPESKDWRDEWDELNIEYGLLAQDQKGEPRDRETVRANRKALAAKGIGTIEAKLRNFKDEIDFKTSLGWTQADAEAHLCLTGVVGASIARALEEGSSRYASSTYALYMSLQRGALLDRQRGWTPLPVYHHISDGLNSASEKSQRILSIETANKYGFMGFTCMAELHGYDDPNLFTEDGEFMSRDAYKDGKATYKPNKGDVLKIVSKEPVRACEKTRILRSVVLTTPDGGYRVPPNSLITMVKVHKPGEWEAYGKYPKRRRIEVLPFVRFANPVRSPQYQHASFVHLLD